MNLDYITSKKVSKGPFLCKRKQKKKPLQKRDTGSTSLLCVMWMPNIVGHKRKRKYFMLLAGESNVPG